MVKLGFNRGWMNMIMMFVKSVSYSFLVNNNLVGPIISGRGLRQGCSLSPYMFILCTEGLAAMMKHEVDNGTLHGVDICRRISIISHLLFADDSFFFFRVDVDEANVMSRVFATNEKASGQAINFAKLGIFFKKNTDVMLRDAVSAIMKRVTFRHCKVRGNAFFNWKKKKHFF